MAPEMGIASKFFRRLAVVGAGAGPERRCGWRRVAGLVLAAAWLSSSGLAGELMDEPVDVPYETAPDEVDIASATADVLRGAQFSQEPLDSAFSSRFLDIYLDALDSRHLVFLQSDVDEFGWFRPELAQMTAQAGDTWPAHLIYARYLKRLAEQVNFETNFLQTARFDFNGSDTWQPERHRLPRPRDLAAAQALWRQQVRADYLEEKLAGRPAGEIAPRLARHYGRRLQAIQKLNFDEVLELYLDAFAHAFDPHSDYFGHEEAQEFNNELSLSLSGIGGSLEAKGGNWVIGSLVPGGPAARSGRLHPGDRIVAVGQGNAEPEEVTDLPSWQVINLIRGPEGSTVRLTIVPLGEGGSTRKTVALVRENVKLADQYARASVIDLPQARGAACRVGVINLPLFYQGKGTNSGGAAADVARLLQSLKQVDIAGLILDLRRNPGGSLNEAIKLTGLFIPMGPVLQTRDAKGRTAVERSPGTNALYGGPLIVLTSRHSASAAEVVAGTLQDYGRAVIVGDSATFGKGTAQALVPLKTLLHRSGTGTVKVTVAKFYRPSGASTQLKGVVSDIILPSESDLPGTGEGRLENALPWDTVLPTIYRKFDLVRPVLSGLRAKSNARVAADPWFQRVRGELAGWAAQGSRPLSLNESVRRQDDARVERLQQELQEALQTEASPPRRGFGFSLAADTGPVAVVATAPSDDRVLRETENILADYVQSLQLMPGELGGMNLHSCQTRPPRLLARPGPRLNNGSLEPITAGRRAAWGIHGPGFLESVASASPSQ